VIGRREVVGAATREQLTAFHAERYDPRGVVIAAAGSLEHDALVELARAGGPRERAGADADGRHIPPPPRFTGRVSFLEKDTEQYHVCVGGRGIARDDERRFALRVLEGVLGGTSSSRLFQEVRERRGLAYAVFCFSNLYARTGEVGVYVGTRPENLLEALEVVARELARCAQDPASDEELQRSRENLKGRVVLALESTGARMSRLGTSVMNELPIMSVDETIERIDAVGIEDCRKLAAELFAPAGLSAAAVGPDERAFRGALQPLGGAAALDAGSAGARARTAARGPGR